LSTGCRSDWFVASVNGLCLLSQCFFCNTEDEFDSLCQLIEKQLVRPEKQPLFELCTERPIQWSPLDDGAEEALGATACMGKCVGPVTILMRFEFLKTVLLDIQVSLNVSVCGS
jgi:hypothetical protein